MMFKTFAMAAMVVASSAASAVTTNWGVHGPLEFGGDFVLGANTPIDDTYTFTLPDPSDLIAVSVANNGGVASLINMQVSLFEVGDANALGTFSFGSTATTFDFGALAAGNYYYEVTGAVAPTAVGGSYQINSTLAAVPEPESYALMIAGLAAVGFVARRRRG